MTQLLTDDPDVHPLGAELSGVGMAQAVGVDPPVDPGLPRQFLEQPAKEPLRDAPAIDGAEQWRPGVHPR